jgi:hypothetical protein
MTMARFPDFAGKISESRRDFFPFIIDFACRRDILMLLGTPPNKSRRNAAVPAGRREEANAYANTDVVQFGRVGGLVAGDRDCR